MSDGKSSALAIVRHLGIEALLERLLPEGDEVGRQWHAGDDLGVRLLERRDVAREVVVRLGVETRVDQRVPGLLERGRETSLGVGKGPAVGVVRVESADDLVRSHLAPHVHEDGDDVLEPPEEVVRPLEGLLRIPLAAEEPRLPGHIRHDARHPVRLAHVGDRVGGDRSAADQHQVDVVVEDQALRDRRAAVRVRLRVAQQDLDRVGVLAGADPLAEQLPHLIDGVACSPRRSWRAGRSEVRPSRS